MRKEVGIGKEREENEMKGKGREEEGLKEEGVTKGEGKGK